MIAIVIGIILIIVAILEWVGHITPVHAEAILIGAVGLLVLLGGFIPAQYIRRNW